MKRDLDLIRDIMVEIEGLPRQETLRFIDATTDEGRNLVDLGFRYAEEIDFCDPVRFYHARLLWEVEYVCEPDIIANRRGDNEIIEELEIYRLTMDGHDFLDSIRNETVWNKTKDKLLEVGGSAPLAVIKMAAQEILQQMVKGGV